MYGSPSLENKNFISVCQEERDHYFIRDEDCSSEEYDLDSEGSEEGKGDGGICSSVSLEIHGLQREQRVYFSNQEYHRRLEELKNTHLRNMAELERMYISEGMEWRGEDDDGGLAQGRIREAGQSIRTLQRINSQEELDFHEMSSGSDQSEICAEDTIGELDNRCRTSAQARSFGRAILVRPKEMAIQKQFPFQPKTPCSKPQRRLSYQTGIRIGSSFKITVPKPFQMMLREEERKRHKVRTRSEIELENVLLRRELEELRECQKKFRASPAPAHIHLPLYEILSRRTNQWSDQSRSSGDKCDRHSKLNQASAAIFPQPFHFLEREKKKREAKILAEFGNLGQKEKRQAFKARPMPSAVYGTRRKAGPKTTNRQTLSLTTCTEESETTEGASDPNRHLAP
ncbi:protein FAM161A-like [Solea solea]|uniref:protein FAM161A-like n=1 Tax=Solea solea TaxID=90069 RepID=UPI00272C3D9A|nr:protein FAM161A-like [Solea solea]